MNIWVWYIVAIATLVAFLAIFRILEAKEGEFILKFDRKGNLKELKRGPAIAHYLFRNRPEVWKGRTVITHTYPTRDKHRKNLAVTISAHITCEDPYSLASKWGREWKEREVGTWCAPCWGPWIRSNALKDIDDRSLEEIGNKALNEFNQGSKEARLDYLEISLDLEDHWAHSTSGNRALTGELL